MKKLLSRIIAGALLLAPGAAFAAYNDVTMTTDTSFSVGGVTVSVSGSSATIESITVNASTFSLVLQGGSTITMTAPELAVTTMDVAQSVTSSCSSGIRTLTIPATGATNVTITPSSTACDTSTSSSSGGGGTVVGLIGGGGGGGTSSAPKPVQAPVATPAPTPKPESMAPSMKFKKDFGSGAKGSAVISLQNFLESQGFLKMPPGAKKGTFGNATKQALKAFQKSKGLPATGFVGPKTRAALNADK